MRYSSDVIIYERYLSKTIANDSNESIDFSNVFHHFVSIADQERAKIVLDFIIQHYKEIITLKGYNRDRSQDELISLGYKLKSTDYLDKLEEFLETNKDSLDQKKIYESLAGSKATKNILNDRVKAIKEFFEKDWYYHSLHAELKMENKSMKSTLSADLNDIQTNKQFKGVNLNIN